MEDESDSDSELQQIELEEASPREAITEHYEIRVPSPPRVIYANARVPSPPRVAYATVRSPSPVHHEVRGPSPVVYEIDLSKKDVGRSDSSTILVDKISDMHVEEKK